MIDKRNETKTIQIIFYDSEEQHISKNNDDHTPVETRTYISFYHDKCEFFEIVYLQKTLQKPLILQKNNQN